MLVFIAATYDADMTDCGAAAAAFYDCQSLCSLVENIPFDQKHVDAIPAAALYRQEAIQILKDVGIKVCHERPEIVIASGVPPAYFMGSTLLDVFFMWIPWFCYSVVFFCLNLSIFFALFLHVWIIFDKIGVLGLSRINF